MEQCIPIAESDRDIQEQYNAVEQAKVSTLDQCRVALNSARRNNLEHIMCEACVA